MISKQTILLDAYAKYLHTYIPIHYLSRHYLSHLTPHITIYKGGSSPHYGKNTNINILKVGSLTQLHDSKNTNINTLKDGLFTQLLESYNTIINILKVGPLNQLHDGKKIIYL